jgi:hypothetical protein
VPVGRKRLARAVETTETATSGADP